jgi:hypothetical protein
VDCGLYSQLSSGTPGKEALGLQIVKIAAGISRKPLKFQKKLT